MITRRKFTSLLAFLPLLGRRAVAWPPATAAAAHIPSRTMKVLREGTEIGLVDLASAELESADGDLVQLWNSWCKAGFRVLGSGPEELPAGMYGEALYTIHPGPDDMGLVAIELGMHGYRLEFC